MLLKWGHKSWGPLPAEEKLRLWTKMKTQKWKEKSSHGDPCGNSTCGGLSKLDILMATSMILAILSFTNSQIFAGSGVRGGHAALPKWELARR